MTWRHWSRSPLPRYAMVRAVGGLYSGMYLYNMWVLGGLSHTHISHTHLNLGLWLLNFSFVVSYLTLPFVRARCPQNARLQSNNGPK